jgi:hypothetical protein
LIGSSPPERVRLDVPWLTILKVLSAAALVWIWLQIWPIVMVILVSLVLTVALEPVVRWLERRRFTRGLAVLAVGVVTLVTFGAFLRPWRRSRSKRSCCPAVWHRFGESVAVRAPVATPAYAEVRIPPR